MYEKLHMVNSALNAGVLTVQGRCAFCRYQIHVMEEACAAVIKSRVIKVDLLSKKAYAKCPKCRNWLRVPLQYQVPNAPDREGG